MCIRDSPYPAALAAAEGELARVEALLGNAEIDLRRYRQLARQEAVAGQQLDTAEAQARSYAAQRQRLAAAVADARRLLALTRIVAPHDGRIGLRRVDAGNHVRAGDADGLATLVQTRPISALFTLAETRLDLSPACAWRSRSRRVSASVNSAEIGRVCTSVARPSASPART